ncbi:MAG: hypothetical protein CENE_03816 [Candidatus Celerinatantimonas neptuna]|nr:MAG: hypothetical protein CENE_03816 [Candidatus Celerinatantimonas neptuna]
MGAALIVVVLMLGYKYIDSHLPSKFHFKKSSGWNSYFQVALKGSYYVAISFLCLLVIWCFLFLFMETLNVVPILFHENTHKFTFAFDILNWKLAGFSFPFIAIIIVAGVASFGQSQEEERKLKNPKTRLQIFKEVAKTSPVEDVLLESIKSGANLLVSITLLSRKVYIGMVLETRLEQLDTDMIVIIPFLSGYRDKDTLSLIIDVNYADHYDSQHIDFDSSPFSLMHYRRVLSRDQIESVSLFNSNIYNTFKQNDIN